MYKKRKELAKELSRSESPSPSPDPVEQGSAENQDLQHRAEVTEVYKLPPFKKQRKTPLGIPYMPIQIGYREKVVSASLERVGFSYPDYDRDIKKTLPKKIGWEPLTDPVRKQMREILSDNYKKTLMHVAGASSEGPDENIAHLGEELLKPIAAQIDKTLHLTLFPNKVDSNLLDSGLQDTITQMHKMLENDTRLAAELLVKVDETKNELTKKQGVLDDLLEKNRLAKEGQLKHSHRTLFEDPEDYVQMLMKNPSSREY